MTADHEIRFITMPTGFDRAAGRARMQAEGRAVARMLADAVPPPVMRAAPVAPARGVMRVQADFVVVPGGVRRRDGGHWVDMCQLEVMVAQAALRHADRAPDSPFTAPFDPGQISVARDYRALTEQRQGSALRCASLEAGRSTGGGGSGLFIDSFIQQGAWLAELHRRIGAGVAMDVRRHMDRGNARRPITVRAALDMVVLAGRDVSAVLAGFGWASNGKARCLMRAQLVGALDRMQGYRDP